MASAVERFAAKYTPEPNSGCWLWTGATLPDGYGHFYYEGRVQMAHRASFLMHGGALVGDQQVCHRCDVRACVNPDHLFAGTQKDNVQDCIRKGRRNTPSGFIQSAEWVRRRVETTRSRRLSDPTRGRTGTRCHSAKLTDAQVNEIRECRASGLSLSRIARRFSVSKSTASNVASGRTYPRAV